MRHGVMRSVMNGMILFNERDLFVLCLCSCERRPFRDNNSSDKRLNGYPPFFCQFFKFSVDLIVK